MQLSVGNHYTFYSYEALGYFIPGFNCLISFDKLNDEWLHLLLRFNDLLCSNATLELKMLLSRRDIIGILKILQAFFSDALNNVYDGLDFRALTYMLILLLLRLYFKFGLLKFAAISCCLAIFIFDVPHNIIYIIDDVIDVILFPVARDVKLHMINKYEELVDFIFLEVKEGAVDTFIHRYIWHSPEDTECLICLEFCFSHRMIKLSPCRHEVCIFCARSFIEASLQTADLGFKCPFDESCTHIDHTSIEEICKDSLVMSNRVKQKYIREGLREIGEVFLCPNTDCDNAEFSETPIAVDEFFISKKQRILSAHPFRKFRVNKDQHDLRKFKCVNCNYSYCIICSKIWDHGVVSHSHISCESYQRQRQKKGLVQGSRTDIDLQSEREYKKRGMKRCPRCRLLVQKDGGCNHMTCGGCGHHWCWKCRRAYPLECTTGTCLI